MKVIKPQVCGGVLHWRQFCGMLLKNENGYEGRCAACHRYVTQHRAPKLGQTCTRAPRLTMKQKRERSQAAR